MSPHDSDPARPSHPGSRRLVIEPGSYDRYYWSDIWERRELLLMLAWRDIAVQYKQTAIGVLWAILRPFLTMIVLAFVFGKLAGLPSDGATPYPLLVFAAMLPWFLMSTIVSDASLSLVENAALVQKVYLPRLMLPSASAGVALVDFGMNLVILVVVMLWFGFLPDARVLLLPVALAMAVAAALGPGLILAALSVRYRDVRHAVPFVVQFGLYVSPVGFSTAIIPEQWQPVYALNPAVGVIDLFRWSLLRGSGELNLLNLSISLAVNLCLLRAGIGFFRRSERTFADVI